MAELRPFVVLLRRVARHGGKQHRLEVRVTQEASEWTASLRHQPSCLGAWQVDAYSRDDALGTLLGTLAEAADGAHLPALDPHVSHLPHGGNQ